MPTRLHLSADVRRALDGDEPIVVLESSVLAQGLPVPHNRYAVERMTAAVVSHEAVPAITAVVRGIPTIGLEGEDLERFLRRDGVRKVSARDIAAAIVDRADGATTVAASLALAHLARINVFATGGIGGVHRQLPGQRSVAVDESADLPELARTPIIVVCAGAKSILDLPATWERLETLGIPVVGYRTDRLPGFFTADAGIALGSCVDSVRTIVELFGAHRALGRRQAMLVVQPPPPEFALPYDEVEESASAALEAAARAGVGGSAVTPFLLEAVTRLTGGRSLDANLALLERNASLAAEIAAVFRA